MRGLFAFVIVRFFFGNKKNLYNTVSLLEGAEQVEFLVIDQINVADEFLRFGPVHYFASEQECLCYLEKKFLKHFTESNVFIVEDCVEINKETISELNSAVNAVPMVQVAKPLSTTDRFLNETFQFSKEVNDSLCKQAIPPAFLYLLDYQGCCLISNNVIGLNCRYEFKEHGLNSFFEDFYFKHNKRGYSAILVPTATAVLPIEERKELCTEVFSAKHTDFPERYKNTAFQNPIYKLLNGVLLLSKKKRIVFDCTVLPDNGIMNGTTIATLKIVQNTIENLRVNGDFEISILASPNAIRAYNLEEKFLDCKFVQLHNAKKASFHVLIRTAQPNSFYESRLLSSLALRCIFVIQDIISMDSLHYGSYLDLNMSYAYLANYADKLVFISEFSKNVFISRFKRCISNQNFSVVYHSLDTKEYKVEINNHDKAFFNDLFEEKYIFVFGNDLPHKAIDECVEALSPLGMRVVSVGGHSKSEYINFKSGVLTNEQIATLYSGAEFVIYPTLYEGFGFPIMESISYGKRIWVRDSLLIKEIKERLGSHSLISTYNSYDDLVDQIAGFQNISQKEGKIKDYVNWSWKDVGERYSELVLEQLWSCELDTFRNRLNFLNYFY